MSTFCCKYFNFCVGYNHIKFCDIQEGIKTMRRRSADVKLAAAFFTLLKSTHYTEITVTDIVEEAGLSRTTFYRYYTDVIDMYNKISDGIFKAVFSEFSKVFSSETAGRGELFGQFCEKLESQKEYISLLSGENGGKKFFEIGIDKVFTYLNESKVNLSEEEKFAIKFVLFSGIGTYVKNIMDSTEFDQKYIAIYKKILTDAQEGAGRRNERFKQP